MVIMQSMLFIQSSAVVWPILLEGGCGYEFFHVFITSSPNGPVVETWRLVVVVVSESGVRSRSAGDSVASMVRRFTAYPRGYFQVPEH